MNPINGATRTKVDGVDIVDRFQVPTGTTIKKFGQDTGQPAYYRQILGLVLADGRRLHACAHCEYVHESANSVRPHLNKHGKRGDQTTPTAAKVAKVRAAATSGDLSSVAKVSHQDLRSMSLDEIVALVNRARKAVQERDEWKRRALAAESEIATVRRVFGSLGGTTSG